MLMVDESLERGEHVVLDSDLLVERPRDGSGEFYRVTNLLTSDSAYLSPDQVSDLEALIFDD
jgi:hypothetical protein